MEISVNPRDVAETMRALSDAYLAEAQAACRAAEEMLRTAAYLRTQARDMRDASWVVWASNTPQRPDERQRLRVAHGQFLETLTRLGRL